MATVVAMAHALSSATETAAATWTSPHNHTMIGSTATASSTPISAPVTRSRTTTLPMLTPTDRPRMTEATVLVDHGKGRFVLVDGRPRGPFLIDPGRHYRWVRVHHLGYVGVGWRGQQLFDGRKTGQPTLVAHRDH
jgi:hypothetical protein